jgi:hypothetical protein
MKIEITMDQLVPFHKQKEKKGEQREEDGPPHSKTKHAQYH